LAVTDLAAFITTVHVVPDVPSHPVHPLKGVLPTEAGAVKVTVAVERNVLVNCVLPLLCPLISFGEREMFTPLLGLVEFTVKVYGAM